MEKRELQAGEIVQIHPEVTPFGGAIVVVTESKSFGATGYIYTSSGEKKTVRCAFADIEPTGGAVKWQ